MKILDDKKLLTTIESLIPVEKLLLSNDGELLNEQIGFRNDLLEHYSTLTIHTINNFGDGTGLMNVSEVEQVTDKLVELSKKAPVSVIQLSDELPSLELRYYELTGNKEEFNKLTKELEKQDRNAELGLSEFYLDEEEVKTYTNRILDIDMLPEDLINDNILNTQRELCDKLLMHYSSIEGGEKLTLLYLDKSNDICKRLEVITAASIDDIINGKI